MKRFKPEEVRNFAARLATAAGVPSSDAEILARSLVDADLHGVSTHGVSRLNIYLQQIKKGLIDPKASVGTTGRFSASATPDASRRAEPSALTGEQLRATGPSSGTAADGAAAHDAV